MSQSTCSKVFAVGKSEINGEYAMHEDINEVFGPSDHAPTAAPKGFGLPGVDGLFSDDVKQCYEDTCAVRSQELILRDFGFTLSEDSLRQEASEHGWYALGPEGGTPSNAVGNLLELHGIAVNRYENANIFNLTSELAQGHRVIVAVDSGELWDKNSVLAQVWEKCEDSLFGKQPDHAVIVSGVDVSDPDHPVVVVTDPGTGEVAARYTLPTFLNAWEDSGFSMVATASSPPCFPMAHLDSIGELPYSTFADWYPAVAHLDDSEPAFANVCDEYEQLLQDPDYYQHHDILDLLSDSDGDGVPDSIDEDADGILNGLAFEGGEEIVDPVAMDTDGDGLPDAWDLDGNGLPDVDGDGHELTK
jgi:hypothetical protein